jgi:hypothetical protein
LAVDLSIQLEVHLHRVQVQRMAQGDQLGGPLGSHDPGNPGHGQHIALGHGLFGDAINNLLGGPHPRGGHGHPGGLGFRANVHHAGPPLFIEV